MPLSDIVNVTITRQTAGVSRAGFGTAILVGIHLKFTERIKFYSSLTAVAADFDATDNEHIAASDYFAQNPTPTQVAIGRRKVDDPVGVAVSTVSNDVTYDVTINGTTFSFLSDSDATGIEIATGLVAAIEAGSEPVTATDDLDGTFTLSADVASTPYTLVLDTKLSLEALTVTEAIGDTMDAIVEESNQFYGVVMIDRTQATVELMAAWIDPNQKVFLTASSDADIIDTTNAADTTTIAATLKASAFARSGVFYNALASTEFMDAAAFGKILPLDPGSYTLKFKTLASITVDSLSDTQRINAHAKNANTYTEVGGVNIIENGTFAEPEFVDAIIFLDWLAARMQERIFGKLVNLPKVPFTDPGIGIVEAEVKAQLQQGIDRGGLAADPAPTTSVPLVKDVSAGNKAARTLPDVKFTAVLAGAIHEVTVNGIVTL